MNEPRQIRSSKSLLEMFRFSMAGFLLSLVLLFAAAPFAEQIHGGETLESSALTLVMISGAFAVGRHRRVLWLTVFLGIPTAVAKWLNHFWPDTISPVWFLPCVLVFMIFILIQLLHFILTAPRVNGEVLCAGISSYLLLGLLWAFAYRLVDVLVPGAFLFDGRIGGVPTMNSLTSVYFSFITLTTVGYGDIAPVAGVARMLAAMEAMTGTLFVAILIARLVSMYSKHPPVGESVDKH